jgi:hypothetical protein
VHGDCFSLTAPTLTLGTTSGGASTDSLRWAAMMSLQCAVAAVWLLVGVATTGGLAQYITNATADELAYSCMPTPLEP